MNSIAKISDNRQDEIWKNRSVDVGIIIALQEEFTEFHKHIEDKCEPVPDENNLYYYFFDHQIADTDRKYRCVATFVGDMGMTEAALHTQELDRRCSPETIVMLGIAGGISDDVMLGDVVVATMVEDYMAHSRAVDNENGIGFHFELSGKPYLPSVELINLARNLRFAHRTHFQQWNKSCLNENANCIPIDKYNMLLDKSLIRDNILIFDGHIASGSTVGASKAFLKWLKEKNRKYLALDMESGGVMTAVYQNADPNKTLILRGISDYADERKKELDNIGKGGIRRYAMHNATQLLWCVLNTDKLPRSAIAQPSEIKISLAKMPTTSHDVFGREKELDILDKAWGDTHKNIVSIVAWGGTGKTALANRWLNDMEKDNYKGAEMVLGWSFYSQGASEGKQVSADQFIGFALRWFGDTEMAESSASAWDKGERLAELVKSHRTLLVLDGLEPLQNPTDCRIKDPALQALLKELASHNTGLCVITTRLKVDDIKHYVGSCVEEIELVNLSEEAGAELLKTLGVKGFDNEIKDAVKDFKGHALALTLLGTYLKTVYHGDIRYRSEIPKLTDEKKQGAHARRVMESYEKWFKGKPELDILYIMGLFDRTAEGGAIDAVRKAPIIEGLTDSLQGLSPKGWGDAIDGLRTARLLAEEDPNRPNDLDCHPLIREHFGEKLKTNNPKAWKESHSRLYEWYKSTAKPLPDTIEEMTPLYSAVSHGCQAGRYQEALTEVYWQRIKRGQEHYSTRKLGAFGSDLSALSGFFDPPWSRIVDGLSEDAKAFVLNDAGFRLRALSRLKEATEPMQAGLENYREQKDWENAATNASNLSELYLTIGDVAKAVDYGKQSVELADKSRDAGWRMASRTTYADALHQVGRLDEAESLFIEAERMQKEDTPKYPLLYSLQGYLYCDLLLEQGKYEDVLGRAEQTLEYGKEGYSLLDIALDHLSLGRAHMLKAQKDGDFANAYEQLDLAVNGLRQAGTQHQLPRGLLARAGMWRLSKDFEKAEKDLAEAFAIAERGEMGLHLADCHLGYARLYVAMGDKVKAKEHRDTAKKLIDDMGYHRRDKEVKALDKELGEKPTP